MKSIFTTLRFHGITLFAAVLLVFSACDKNEDPTPDTPNEHVNKWIYGNMDFWYYWADELPSETDQTQDPLAYFYTLVNAEDRFSWIQDDYEELVNSLRGVSKESGFEFAIYLDAPESTTLIMQILYVKANSPALQAGLKRGDVITHISGNQLKVDNYQQLISVMSESHSLTYKPIDYETKSLGSAQTINLVPVEYAENPNYMSKVFTYDDRKIGYYVYTLFSEGPDGTSKAYVTEMDNVIAGFKAQGITDIIIDLRYNSGGIISAAQNMASLLGKNVNSSTVFARNEYNDEVTAAIKADPNLGEKILTTSFLTKSQNIGTQLRDGRVYILTGGRTASASEMVINALRPYMDVFLVGNTTLGKNVGSISLFDEEDPENPYGIQPIVTKIFNSANQSDYTNGFTPQVMDADNNLYVYPLGDPRESLLNKALQQITGDGSVSRTNEGIKAGDILYHSLDSKRRTGVLLVDSPLKGKK